MARLVHAAEWSGENVTVAEVERELAELRKRSMEQEGGADLLTRVMTHVAWTPEEWLEAAARTREGLAERHPSRVVQMIPRRDGGGDAIDAEASLECFAFAGLGRHVCVEFVKLSLRGARAKAPASIVSPLLIADLPAFLRWRGRPDFGSTEFGQMVGVVDRLVVDSSEWPDVPAAYGELAEWFERVGVSDIAWSRTTPWRRALALRWPGIAESRELRVEGPRADASLLVGWLRSRLQRDVELVHVPAERLELVAVDGDPVVVVPRDTRTASDLLSEELDRYGRDPMYEEAVRAA